MLKIKDNLDLKELEKFGFEFNEFNENEEEIYYDYFCGDGTTYLQVFVKTRQIALNSGIYGDYPEFYFDKQLDIIFDLIEAGLVEKV